MKNIHPLLEVIVLLLCNPACYQQGSRAHQVMQTDAELCHCPLTSISTHPSPWSGILCASRLDFYLRHISKLTSVVRGYLFSLYSAGHISQNWKKKKRRGTKRGKRERHRKRIWPSKYRGNLRLWRHAFNSLLCQIPCIMWGNQLVTYLWNGDTQLHTRGLWD